MSIYFIGMLLAGCFWLVTFFADKETPKTDVVSWAALILASIFWPIAVPFSCIELFRKMRADKANDVRGKNLV